MILYVLYLLLIGRAGVRGYRFESINDCSVYQPLQAVNVLLGNMHESADGVDTLLAEHGLGLE